MDFGYLPVNDSGGIRPDVLARELESRGFDSIWMPEHSHIPTSRETPYPAGGDLPDGYWQMMDPFVSLMAAASASERLRLYTGCASSWNTICSTWPAPQRPSTC
jgi:alkanesulfonate monooxygenase SsuD/methylene tetrahydromethanopterin reductase-like flavin-dependent oxidoreductase (luciferase family)